MYTDNFAEYKIKLLPANIPAVAVMICTTLVLTQLICYPDYWCFL